MTGQTEDNSMTERRADKDLNGKRPLKIALTGGIGSGKSFVCRLLQARGICIYDCDDAAKRLMRESEDIRIQLTQLIGEEAYQDGRPNKAVVSKFLLASETNTEAINNIVHPAVARDFEESGMSWMECAILFESGFDRLVDKVVAVVAPTPLRVERIMARDHIEEKMAQEWIDKQMTTEELIQRADFVVYNDGTKELEGQLDRLLETICC